jgi:hypothetical protein
MGRLVTNTGSTRRIDAERFLVDVLQAGHLNRSALIHKLSWRERICANRGCSGRKWDSGVSVRKFNKGENDEGLHDRNK